MKADHTQLLIDWIGDGSNVVVSLTREKKTSEQNSTRSSIFISYDYGATFQNKTHMFRLENNETATISSFYKNDKFPSRVSLFVAFYRNIIFCFTSSS